MLLLAACSDTSLTVGAASNDASPDIVVSPGTLDFGAVPFAGSTTGVVRIDNLGDAALSVEDLVFSGDGAFTLAADFQDLWIPAGSGEDLALLYSPVNAEDAGWVTVYSNDPDEPALPVALLGRGAFPQLEIAPNPLDLGAVELCEADARWVELRNVGEDDLELTQLLVSGEGLSLLEGPELPVSLAPGEVALAQVGFEPLRASGVAGELWVDSNDPAGARKADLQATGVVDGLVEATDTFRQPDGPWARTDLMFFIDRSCSMGDDEANLVSNIGLLADQLDRAASDWQIMVTIDDNGCHEGDFITPETEDVVGAFRSALATAPGDFTEAGLTIAAEGLERSVGGGCNQGFLREDSKTLVVMLSDEPEQSPDPWQDYVARMQAASDSVGIVAVVGDLPHGCTTAEAGSGYVEAADATGGMFLSICSADWGDYFDVVGELATGEPSDRFVLSHDPEPATIEVLVDGTTERGWTFEAESRTVVLDDEPEPLSLVEIHYALGRECPEDAADAGGDTGAP